MTGFRREIGVTGRSAGRTGLSGFSLVEMALSVGVLAVAVPLAFAAMGEAGRSGGEAALENRSAWIVQACLGAVERARDGEAGWFEATPAGMPFPPEGEVWALAFAADGSLLGRASREQYEQGVRRIDGCDVRYLACSKASVRSGERGMESLLGLTVTVEYPAALPSDRRKRATFHSLIR